MARPPVPAPVRFHRKYVVREDGCWEWQTNQRYGAIEVDGVVWLAHRYSYTLHAGPIPDGLHIDHLCRVTRCVNPEHLEPVTPRENTRRHIATITHCPQGHEYAVVGQYAKGGKCKACSRDRHRARLKNGPRVVRMTPDRVADMRARSAAGEGTSQLAVEFGISHSYAARIINGERPRSAHRSAA